jgi:alpha-L-arabinofuranosidase
MVEATPTTSVLNTTTTATKSSVKTATTDIIQFDDETIIDNAEVIVDLLFENIGGQELLTIARYDTVNGQDVKYQPIKNLKILQEEYNPNNLIKVQQTSDKYFANFPIKLNDKIPNQGNGPQGSNVYLTEDDNIILEFINLESDEQVDVQITINGTIYEVGK